MAEINVRITAAARELLRELDKVERAVDEVGDSAKGMGDDLDRSARSGASGLSIATKGVLALGGAFVAAKAKDFIGDALNLGIAAEEAGNKFNAVFGPAADDLSGSLETLGDKAGIADFKLENMVGTTGNVILGLGGSTDEASKFAEKLAPLAVDVASFNGEVGNSPDVLKAMTSALTGEREALKTYGIVIKEADVQQRALALSGKDAASELTNLEKATATLELIAEGAGAAVGDLDRNLDSAATQQAQLTAEWQEAQAELGQELLPAMQDFVGLLREAIPLMSGAAGVAGDVASGLAAIIEGLSTERSFVDVIQLSETLDRIAKRAANTEAPLRTAAEGMATLAKQGEATTDSIDAVQRITGISGAMMEEAARQALAYAKANGFTESQIDSLEAAVRRYNQRGKEQIDRFGISADEAHLLGLAVGRQNLAGDMEDLEEATDEATTAVHDMIGAQRALVDPMFRARDSLDKLEEAQLATNKARDEFGAESPEFRKAAEDQAKAALELKADMTELGKGGFDQNREALRRLYVEMGFAPAEVAALLAEWDRINDFQFARKSIVVDVSADPRVTLAPGSIGRAAHGGTAVRGGLTLVGEEGPEIVDLPTGATVYPNGTGPGNGGGPTIIVQGFVGSEMQLAQEIDRLLTRRGRTQTLGFT